MKKKIGRKLLLEIKERNLKLVFPHIAVLVCTTVYLREIKAISLLSVAIGAVLISRILLVRHFIRKDSLSLPAFETIFASFVGIVGFLWGGIFSQAFDFYGLYSVKTLVVLGIIFTVLTGGVTAFSSSRKIVATHLISLSTIPILKFFQLGDDFFILGVLLVCNLVYQIYHAFMANTLLKKSFQNEIVALSQKETIQQFIDAIPGLVIVLDEDKNYLMVNNYSDGFFRERLSDRKLGDLFPRSDITTLISDFYESNETSLVKEVRSIDLGSENWFMVNLKKISHPRTGVIAAILPINELIQAKNDLKIQEARSQYAAKLASLGELSAGIAHEVNNPLTIIEGAASLMKMMLKDETLDKAALEKTLIKIIDTSQRIARIIKSLKTLAGDAEDEPFQNIKFRSIVEPSVEISKNKLVQHEIKLNVVNLDSDVELFGNEIQLSQVIMNLVSNAIDAVKDQNRERLIEIRYEPSFEWIDILILDNGCGVPHDIKDKIMEPFFTTKESNQGTGLGLSISRSIINSHEGFLDLIPGTMTTFRIRLPRMTPWKGSKKMIEEDTAAVP